MNTLRWILTGGFIPICLLLCGGFFLIDLRLQPFLSPKKMIHALKKAPSDGISPFRAVTLALAGTLGVGNIVGVASALVIGGAGAIFWMWISACLAMILKYAEILLAVKYRHTRRDGSCFGGAVYYIRACFSRIGRAKLGGILAITFSLLMILDALTMGCVIQVNAIASSLDGILGIPPALCGILLLLLALPVIVRGSKGVSALTEYLVPIMSIGYLILSLAVLVLCRNALLPTLSRIASEAISPMGAVGGILGFLTSRALRVGTMRGILSNEAGCGTAPTAHACAQTDSPAAQGVWGIFEVFVDTILLCTLTALVILLAFPDLDDFGLSPVMMTVRAYSAVLGDWASYFLCAAILCFGYATVICWAGYGAESVRAISPKKRYRVLYFLLYGACILLGARGVANYVWDIADFAIASLTAINLSVLLLMRREIRQETALLFPPKALPQEHLDKPPSSMV